MNLALIAAVLSAGRSTGTKIAAPEANLQPSASSPAAEESSAQITLTNAALVRWDQLSSPDFFQYRDRLRAVGCPEETIRDILLSEIDFVFNARNEALLAEFQGQFWNYLAQSVTKPDADSRSEIHHPNEHRIQMLDEEKTALIARLFGKNANESTDPPQDADDRFLQDYRRKHDWLPVEKRDRLAALELNYNKKRSALSSELPTEADHRSPQTGLSDREKALDAELEAERRKILSPAEFEEFELRDSNEAYWAGSLPTFTPTEDEWRTVTRLKIQASKTERETLDGILKPEDAESFRTALHSAYDEKIRKALGDERFEEYNRDCSADYEKTLSITRRHALDDGLAAQCFKAQQAAETAAQNIRDASALPAEERQLALAAIQKETERELSRILNSKVFATYQKYHGSWLTNLGSAQTQK
ncbi:MAG TPA: hypothetical protein VK327_10565 [Candidatus Paceibacterota bacterium]|nr:hypothetical protein [Candidatus Paceibacterota bacterium]